MSYIENLTRIRAEVNEIAKIKGRNPEEIKVIAVSKTLSVDIIQKAIDEGISLLGENKVQEAGQKIPQLKGEFIFHMIGHLQSNKAREAVKLFDVIHSIDKMSTAERVGQEAGKVGKKQMILVQINTSGEESKSGADPDNAVNLCRDILGLENIELMGLMTIGPFTSNESRIRESFSMLKTLLDEINSSLKVHLKELSMGMSSDYQIALEEGATMLRIGTSIFGERHYDH